MKVVSGNIVENIIDIRPYTLPANTYILSIITYIPHIDSTHTCAYSTEKNLSLIIIFFSYRGCGQAAAYHDILTMYKHYDVLVPIQNVQQNGEFGGNVNINIHYVILLACLLAFVTLSRKKTLRTGHPGQSHLSKLSRRKTNNNPKECFKDPCSPKHMGLESLKSYLWTLWLIVCFRKARRKRLFLYEQYYP
jgi:hypothetical protein